jgi:hypothetical protein
MSKDATAIASALATVAPRLAHYVGQRVMPTAVSHALALMIGTMVFAPDYSAVFDRRQMAWPPHRRRGTVRPRNMSAERFMRRDGNKKFFAEPKLAGGKGLR